MSKYGRKAYDTLKVNKLAPKKRLGQNFLVNQSTALAIVKVGNVHSEETVIEVGVGLGALTIPLAKAAQHVFGYEIDSGIIRLHEQERDLPENVTLIHQDILKTDFKEIERQSNSKLIILANLPYSISNPFIFKLIDNSQLLERATVMVQKEVADRLCSQPRSKDYGVPTILLASCATVRNVMTLHPAEFHPRPKVDSVVINIDFAGPGQGIPQRNEYNYELLKKIVKAAFNQRRKTILNTLSGTTLFKNLSKMDKIKKAENKELTLQAIKEADISEKARPEELSIKEFIKLTNTASQLMVNSET